MTVNQHSNDYRRFLHRFARTTLQSNNFYKADLACQVCLSRFADDPVAYNLQGLIAHKLGLFSHAERFFKQALLQRPEFTKAQENLALNQTSLSKLQTNKLADKFHLINAWGSGMGFELVYLLQQLLLAELTNRTPVIHWGANSLYYEGGSNCFDYYFEPINKLSLENLQQYQPSVFPEYWQGADLAEFRRRTVWVDKRNQQRYRITSLYYLQRQERITVSGEHTNLKPMLPWIEPASKHFGKNIWALYRELAARYLIPVPALREALQKQIHTLFGSQPFIAIHLRGNDKYRERQSANIAQINADLLARLQAENEGMPVFVMTDDPRELRKAKQALGQRVNSLDVTRIQDDMQGVHHLADNKGEIGREVLLDALVASKAQAFYGCGFSYLACAVACLRTDQQATHLLPYDLLTGFRDIPVPGMYGIV